MLQYGITIGSKALEYHGVDIGRKPSDHDVLCTSDQAEHLKSLDLDIIDIPKHILDTVPHKNGYAIPEAVLTLKASSLGWDIHWDKHYRDVMLLKHLGFNIIPELYSKLSKYWGEVNGNKPHLDFYKTKKDFFNDYVVYHYDHDYLHEVLAHPNKPLYLSLLEDGQEVAIDYNKFMELPHDLQVRLFKEEIGVIAAERWLIPPKLQGKYTWIQAYILARKKMFISLTKDWQTDFLIQNIEEFSKPDFSLFKNFLEEGIITMELVSDTDLGALLAEMFGKDRQDILEDYGDELTYLFHEGEYVKNIPNFKFIEKEGGNEGDGEYCHIIFKFKDIFYKITGFYYSYTGVEVDSARLYIVHPQEKTITVYE